MLELSLRGRSAALHILLAEWQRTLLTKLAALAMCISGALNYSAIREFSLVLHFGLLGGVVQPGSSKRAGPNASNSALQ